MGLICLFLYFTSMQFFYRGSHRERFSSLQLGGVCPGSGLCNFNVEWTLLILEVFGLHLVTLLLLPMFTLGYKGGSQGRKDLKTIELKIKRKIKKENDSKLDVPDDPSALYDADDDLLSDKDELILKTAKLSKAQVISNIVQLKRGLYLMMMMSSLLFFCSSVFAYATSRDIIFPERSAPKYIFDSVQFLIMMALTTIWV